MKTIFPTGIRLKSQRGVVAKQHPNWKDRGVVSDPQQLVLFFFQDYKQVVNKWTKLFVNREFSIEDCRQELFIKLLSLVKHPDHQDVLTWTYEKSGAWLALLTANWAKNMQRRSMNRPHD